MEKKNIVLVGNPNVGKTSLFNRITKLKQKVGNYPGVTVEKREGEIQRNNTHYRIVDLPGTYSICPSSLDEEIVYEVLQNKQHTLHPDQAIVVTEPASIQRGIVLYQQVRAMNIPAIFVVNMSDEMQDKGIDIDFAALEALLKTKIHLTNARKSTGIEELIADFETPLPAYYDDFTIPQQYTPLLQAAQHLFPLEKEYTTWLYLANQTSRFLAQDRQEALDKLRADYGVTAGELQKFETLSRRNNVLQALQSLVSSGKNIALDRTSKIDSMLLHPVIGYVVFLGLLLLIFQAIFTWSGPLMDAIDGSFGWITEKLTNLLPEGPLSALLLDGIIAGIGGIVVFVPQIVILFLFLSIMEESGYMSRVVFLMDRWLRPFGLNGKSVIPLMSGVACAIPAVMSARNIENPKERLITMLVTPFMTCSARLPIYTVLIALVIPDETFLGFNVQGLVLFGMYILGTVAALLSSWVLHKFVKSIQSSFLIFEIPTYKMPDWKNVALNVWEKASSFLFGAGKIIIIISIILWVLGNFGPNDRFSSAEIYVTQEHPELEHDALAQQITSYRLEHSYLGYIGMGIEPVVRPLGYDWKMGIGLISSFAAREVFVGTMAVVYSLGDDIDIEDEGQKNTLLGRMKSEINANTGLPAYNLASGISLLLFYALAMQCMATIAVVRRETGSWKWTIFQLVFMTGLAYLVAWIGYQLLK